MIMRQWTRLLAVAVAIVGLSLAGWGPIIFTLISGRQLPAPISGDAAALLVWSGVAFLRVLGATLFVLGSVVATTQGVQRSPRAAARTLAVTGALATLVVLIQAQAIWSTPFGFGLATVFGMLTLAGAIGGWGQRSEA
jgi:hypothetical protein